MILQKNLDCKFVNYFFLSRDKSNNIQGLYIFSHFIATKNWFLKDQNQTVWKFFWRSFRFHGNMVTSNHFVYTLWWCQFYILMNQRWVVAEIREIWCKNAVTSSEQQHKVQGLSLDCSEARPQPPWSQSRPEWILRCYATLWDFFTELKLKFLETSLILRGTVKNVALELGPSERKTVLLSLLKFSFCPWHWVNYCIHFRMVLWRF